LSDAAGAGASGLPPRWRIPMLAIGLASLVLGTLAGLLRAGVPVPLVRADHVALHAVLMFGGFFGTVISLERAVALGRAWGYGVPALAAAGAIAIWVGAQAPLAAVLHLAAGALLVAASWKLYCRQPQLHAGILVAGAACWPLGTLAWVATGAPAGAIGLWSCFLVLTIAGERLELSRLMPPKPGARRVFVAIVAACVAAAALGAVAPWPARGALGACFVALALWLVRHDIARRTARAARLTGFIGRALLAGYAWLVVGGVLLVAAALSDAPLLWDGALHAVLLGFVMSMVLGHAPIIFPAVVRVRMPYHPVFYLPLVLLHGTLAVRIGADLVAHTGGRAGGAAGNAVALAAFVLVTVATVVRGRRR